MTSCAYARATHCDVTDSCAAAKMTVDLDHISQKIQNEFKRDILVQLLSAKTSPRRRKELVFSARTSMSSHVSRRLMQEEHKLDVQLKQIEKERRHFLNNNNNEKHMLRLSLGLQSPGKYWTQRGSYDENAKARRQQIRIRYSQGNQPSRQQQKPGSPINNSNYKALTARQNWMNESQHNNVLMSQQEAEMAQLKNTWSWPCSYDTPQVPPPSRTASRCSSTVSVLHHPRPRQGPVRTPQRSDETMRSHVKWDEKDNRHGAVMTARPAATKKSERDVLKIGMQKTKDGKNFCYNSSQARSLNCSQDSCLSSTNRSSATKETCKDVACKGGVIVNIMQNNASGQISMSPSVRRLDIADHFYQFAQKRGCSANSQNSETQLEKGKHSDDESTSENIIGGRDEVGDNRSAVGEGRMSAVGRPCSGRSEIGSSRQRRPRRPRNRSHKRMVQSCEAANTSTSSSEKSLDIRVLCQKVRSEKNISTDNGEETPKIVTRIHSNGVKCCGRKKNTGNGSKKEKTKLNNQTRNYSSKNNKVGLEPKRNDMATKGGTIMKGVMVAKDDVVAKTDVVVKGDTVKGDVIRKGDAVAQGDIVAKHDVVNRDMVAKCDVVAKGDAVASKGTYVIPRELAVELYNETGRYGTRACWEEDDEDSTTWTMLQQHNNSDADDDESWVTTSESPSSRHSTPSPFCLPSPSQMRNFEENAITNRKKTTFIKMRRYGHSYRKPPDLQPSLARDT